MYKVLDLFAGAGGMSLGFTQQGDFEIIGVIENNDSAAETFLFNHQKNASKIKRKSDITDKHLFEYLDDLGDVEIVIGGPPCQGFSNANRQKNKLISMNNSLVKKFADVVLYLKPKAFIMENVAMLKSPVHKFFDTNADHHLIDELKLETKKESIVVYDTNPDGIQMLDLLRNKEEIDSKLISEKIINEIKLIKRYWLKEDKLKKYLDKHKKIIVQFLKEYIKKYHDDTIGLLIRELITTIVDFCEKEVISEEIKLSFEKFIEFAKAISLIHELYANDIQFEFEPYTEGRIRIQTVSYTVYEYLSKRLGSSYHLNEPTVLNAANFGAPQERKRFILIGLRNNANCTKEEMKIPIKTDKYAKVHDVISDLEKYPPTFSVPDAGIVRELSDKKNTLIYQLQDNQGIIYNHVTTKTTKTALERFKKIKPGQNFHSLDKEMKTTYSKPERTQNTIYLRLEYDKPCGTVVNVRKSMWIHPVEHRAISIREAARLQTFPDSYIFKGSKDSQYQQIGNAVPPMLARAIAEVMAKLMKEKFNG